MGIEETITRRRSIRKFNSTPVEIDTIIELLENAIWAPSASNRQDYRFIVADDRKLISRIVDAGGSHILLNGDKVIFVLYSSFTDNQEYADNIQSASAIIQNFILLAHERKIGTCWICHLPRKKVLHKLLNIPAGLEVIAAVVLGHTDFSNLKTVERKYAVKDVLGYNTFYSKYPLSGNRKLLYIRIPLNKLYYLLPTFIKKLINGFLDKHFVKKFEN